MCIACSNPPPPPEWSIERKKQFVSYFEEIDPEEVTDELIDHYEAAIGLETCFLYYGALSVPSSYIEEYCCRDKQ